MSFNPAVLCKTNEITTSTGRHNNHTSHLLWRYTPPQYRQSQDRRKNDGIEKAKKDGKGSHIYNEEKTYFGIENQRRYWGGCQRRGGVCGDDCISKIFDELIS